MPVGDLTTVLAVKSASQKAGALQPGAWVRLKRLPKYKGDVARVVAVTQGGAAAIVQIEPVCEEMMKKCTCMLVIVG